MTTQELINSGDLELFVAGKLPEDRMREISARVKSEPEIREEVERIEDTVVKLAENISPTDSSYLYTLVAKKIIPVEHQHPRSYSKYLAWAACLIFFFGMGYFYMENNRISDRIDQVATENEQLLKQYDSLETSKEQLAEFSRFLTDKNTVTYRLPGQNDLTSGEVKVFKNTETGRMYVDISQLPEPPENMVYQMWSLKFKPLTPVSLGVMDKSPEMTADRIYAFEDAYASEGYGITLEKAGGSKKPTLERLYALGKI